MINIPFSVPIKTIHKHPFGVRIHFSLPPGFNPYLYPHLLAFPPSSLINVTITVLISRFAKFPTKRSASSGRITAVFMFCRSHNISMLQSHGVGEYSFSQQKLDTNNQLCYRIGYKYLSYRLATVKRLHTLVCMHILI